MNNTRQESTGFSLVEVAIAIGIVSFALLACVGVNAVSLTSFSDARSVDVSSRIFRSVLNEAQTSDFPEINALAGTRYCDSEGFLTDNAHQIYRVEIRVQNGTEITNGNSPTDDFILTDTTAKKLTVDVYRLGQQQPGNPLSRRCAIIGRRTKG